MGFDPNSFFIYATQNNSNNLLRIDSTGAVTNLGPVTGLPTALYAVGAFDPAGNFWVTTGGGTTVYEINVNTRTVINTLQLSAPFEGRDFAYANGFMWGIHNTTIYRLDLADGAVDSYPAPPEVSSGQYGAAWTFGNDNLAFSNNPSATTTTATSGRSR